MRHFRVKRRGLPALWAATFASLAASAGPAGAQVFTWTGAGGNNLWSSPTNWSPNGVPNVNSDAVFTTNASPTSGSARNLTTAATLSVPSGSSVTVVNTLTNTGTLALGGSGAVGFATLNLAPASSGSTVSLTGSGTVSLSNQTYSVIYVNPSALSNTNVVNVDNTIRGTGVLSLWGGQNNFSNNFFTNHGTVSADVAGSPLTLAYAFSFSGAFVNTGLMEARNGGNLVVNANLNNNGGTLLARDGSTVTFSSGYTTTGGTLSSVGTGTLRGNGGILSNVTNTGSFSVPSGSSVTVVNTLTNTGTLALGGSGAVGFATLNLAPASSGSTVSLTGSGTVSLSNQTYSVIYVNPSALSNTNVVNVDNTIRGTGVLSLWGGQNNFSNNFFTNHGTVSADVAGSPLTLAYAFSFSGAFVNTGLMEARNGGNLVVNANLNNNGGTLLARDGSTVTFSSGYTTTGGTLSSVGTGTLRGNGGILSNVTNTGSFSVPSGSSVTVVNTLTNTGTLALGGSGAVGFATLNLAPASSGSTVSLTGSGTVSLSNQTYSVIYVNPSALSNTNVVNVDNTIRGTGVLSLWGGQNNFSNNFFTNHGTVSADVAGSPLTLAYAFSFSGAFVNTGLMEARNGGNLVVNANLNNNGGTLLARDGSTVTFSSGYTTTGGMLTGTPMGRFIVSSATVSPVRVEGGQFSLTSGIFAPQVMPGTAHLDGLTNSGSATLSLRIAQPLPTLYDAVAVTGAATLGGNLSLSFLPGFTLTPGSAFKLIDIGGTRTGTFANRAEGSTVGTFAGVPLYITYAGGNGNDVTLYSVPTGQVPASSAGPNQTAYFVGSNPGPSGGGGTNTYNYQSFNLLGGSSYTLGSGETLNLNNGAGTLIIGPGSVFVANGNILGSILNSGLLSIPITRAGLITRTTGGVVNVAPPPTPPPTGTPVVITAPPTTTVNPGTFVGIGGSGIGGGSGGGGGFGGSGGYYAVGSPGSPVTITSGGTTAWDGRLDVSGGFTQTATGVLRLFIAGTTKGETYSHLAVGQSATVDGTLQIVLQPELFGFVPVVGDYFDFITAAGGITVAPDDIVLRAFVTAAGASRLGYPVSLFTPYSSPFAEDPNALLNLDGWDFNYTLIDGGQTLRATLVSITVIPEPSAVLSAVGAAAAPLRRRRR